MTRIKLTSIVGSASVYVWTQHITAVFPYVRGRNAVSSSLGDPPPDVTMVSVVGGRDPLGVQESVDEVLALIDSANRGLLA